MRPNSDHASRRQKLTASNSEFEIIVTDDGSRTIAAQAEGQYFHSESGALAESRLVFLENSGARQELESGRPFRIFELGFGTGLNFFLTASKAFLHHASLSYAAVDQRVLGSEWIHQLEYSSIEECQPAFDLWVQNKVGVDHASNSMQFECESVQFCLKIGNALEMNFPAEEPCDAIYFDPFSPEFQPAFWQTDFFTRMIPMLKPGGRLVTYCVKSQIQKNLRQAGFEVSKTKGPVGGKREVLIATKS